MSEIDYYSEFEDIQAKVPFTLDENSIPTSKAVDLLQYDAHRFMNAYVGELTVDTETLRWIETDLVLTQILAIHANMIMPFQLKEEHKSMLDQYREDGFVDVVNLGFDT